MTSTNMSVAMTVIGLSRIAFLIVEGALVFVIARNLSISKWMTIALLGTILSLSSGVLQQVLPWVSPRVTSGSLTNSLALIFLVHLVGRAGFVVGLSGVLADVRHQFRLTSAMLGKPPGVDELR